ncbi:DUF4244 domain-containing protein [Cellulosimicrobium sp. Marseille-Q4280]|jgi:hypothetical protein|uniref:DUF4244 domain-containing protein n=1 Tax=Cellulosimicrobium sp. Marseille-Q4280 TaxID=2937992 RepID=UPI0020414ED4|nr:DUF4244 domain-containing protein [Cellulosimicrobium sp. Marseille-Q4280]
MTRTRTERSAGHVASKGSVTWGGAPATEETAGEGRPRRPEKAAGRVLARLTGADGAHDREAGLATAEYAIATVAAAGFAGLLIVVLRSGEVRELLLGIVRSALSLG